MQAVYFSKVGFKLFFFSKDNNSSLFPTGERILDMLVGKADRAAAGLIKHLPNHVKRQWYIFIASGSLTIR